MNIFRAIVTKTPRNRHDHIDPVLESSPGTAPQVRPAPSPASDASTKAEEMMRLMAERRNHPKKTR